MYMKHEFLKIEIQNKKKGMSACIHFPPYSSHL